MDSELAPKVNFFCNECGALTHLVRICRPLECINPNCSKGKANRERFSIPDEVQPWIPEEKPRDNLYDYQLLPYPE